jgi:hypothetical protein
MIPAGSTTSPSATTAPVDLRRPGALVQAVLRSRCRIAMAGFRDGRFPERNFTGDPGTSSTNAAGMCRNGPNEASGIKGVQHLVPGLRPRPGSASRPHSRPA